MKTPRQVLIAAGVDPSELDKISDALDDPVPQHVRLPYEALECSISWRDSPQGFDYWRDIRNDLRDGRLTRPQHKPPTRRAKRIRPPQLLLWGLV